MRTLQPLAYRSEAWHAMRLDSIGGSDIGVIVGMSPFASRDDLMHTKLTGQRLAETPAMEAGLLLEPMAARRAAEALDAEPMDAADTVWRDGRRHYTLDGVLVLDGSHALLEVKTGAFLSAGHGWGKPSPDTYDPDAIPQWVLAQVQWGLMLSGLTLSYVAAMPRVSLALNLYRVEADPAIHAYLAREADAFLADLDTARKELAA